MTPLAFTDTGHGMPLVLVHAFPLDQGMWRGQIEALSDEFRVIAPDVFGFGESPLPDGGWTMERMADALAKLLDTLEIREKIVLGGLSMGGYIGLAFAKRYPERLRGLILADSQAGADSAETKLSRNETIAFVNGNSAAALIEKMLPKMLSPTTHADRPNVIADVRTLASKQTVVGVVKALEALRDRADSTELLKTFDFPTLVIVGEDDAITPPNLAQGMVHELHKKSALSHVPNAGHLSNLEQPELFTAIVLDWLKLLPNR